jgi:hypothetical protein
VPEADVYRRDAYECARARHESCCEAPSHGVAIAATSCCKAQTTGVHSTSRPRAPLAARQGPHETRQYGTEQQAVPAADVYWQDAYVAPRGTDDRRAQHV